MKQAVVWRIIAGVAMMAVSFTFYWLAIIDPDYAPALLFVSFVAQLLIYMVYNNSFPGKRN